MAINPVSKKPIAENRIAINQRLDYRIFVISAYHEKELIGDSKSNLISAMSAQKLLATPTRTESGNYYFFKYSIDDYVPSFDIRRTVDGQPAILNLDIFPTKKNQDDEDFNFFYKWNLQYIPVFRKMDYIEIQVAECTTTDIPTPDETKRLINFQKLLTNPKRSYLYDDTAISSNYKVRFRGFITSVSHSDSANDGRKIQIEAGSVLTYLANTPFISNLALFNTKYFETQRAHILPDQYIVLYGNLLTDLKNTTARTEIFLKESFGPKITSRTEEYSQVIRDVDVNGTLVQKQFKEKYLIGEVSTNAETELTDVINRLDTENITQTTGTQAALLLLAELYYSYDGNKAATQTLYSIFSSELFNVEVQFGGTNTEFISNYVYLLETLQQFRDSLKYVLFEDTAGTIHFERPFFNGPIGAIIDNKRYINYRHNETATGYVTEYFVTPGTAFQIFDDTIRDTFFQTSGLNLAQLRRYGYRRPDPETNPNISVPAALQQYARTSKALNNAALSTISITVPYMKNLDVGSLVWFQEKQIVGYVTEVSERITYGESSTMDVTLSYIRNVLSIDDTKMDKITIDNFLDHVKVEDFPEYNFVSDFYTGNMQSKDQTPVADKQEREVNLS